jgi:preprotein translocase subunit SecE
MNYKEIKEKLINYLKEIRSESRKVVWPGRNYVTAATIIVFIIVLLVALFIMVIDFGFAKFFAYFGRARLR